jgi:hypothetical protein
MEYWGCNARKHRPKSCSSRRRSFYDIEMTFWTIVLFRLNNLR